MSKNGMLVKVVVIGDGNVGKSCLVLRYSEDKFVQSYLATMGSDFTIKLTQAKGVGVRLFGTWVDRKCFRRCGNTTCKEPLVLWSYMI